MSDNGEVEVEAPNGTYSVLPKEVTDEVGSIKLFNKWSYEDVEIRDISLTWVSIASVYTNAAMGWGLDSRLIDRGN
jgi:small subunit ribosomal protein S5e